jgi:hypothetical protein
MESALPRREHPASHPRAPAHSVLASHLDRAPSVPGLRRSDAASPAELVTVPGMAHPLTDEPGIEPAPQSPQAAVVDGLAVRWFQRYLSLPAS